MSRFTRTIKAGKHYDTNWLDSLPFIGKTSMSRHVRFQEDCEYDMLPYNKDDVNKLFGMSFGLFAGHKNSARFGWRWSKSDQCIELLAYVYTDGKKNWDEQLRYPVVAKLPLGITYKCSIDVNKQGDFLFTVSLLLENDYFLSGSYLQAGTKPLPCYGFTQGLYFGGSLVAPHDMHIDVSSKPFPDV